MFSRESFGGSIDDDDSGILFRDLIFLTLLGFVAIVILLLPHLNPPTQEEETAPPGNIIVEIFWPNELDTDVDLWVQAPGDRPVGYSRTAGAIFNLLRDDLGFVRDVTDINYEVAYSRGAPSGEYAVNLHLFSNRAGVLPVPVTVQVRKQSPSGEKSSQIATIAVEKVELSLVGEELTVVRFSLDADGALVEGSIHNLPKSLRSAQVPDTPSIQ